MNAIETGKATIKEFLDDNAVMMSAAIAFYSALSFAPLLIILIWFGGYLGGGTQEQIVDQVRNFVGSEAGAAVEMIVENAEERPSLGTTAGIISILTLIFSATGVFAQLQAALNIVWDVEPKPGQGLMGWIRKRLLSLGLLVTIGFLLLVSLAFSAVLAAMLGGMQSRLPGADALWPVVDLIVSLIIYTLLFAAIFKILPDVDIEWRVVWGGAILTAVLFAIGKWGIGLYLGRSSLGSAYGAAGSLIVLLVWAYYSCIILMLGAEMTQVAAQRIGLRVRPDDHAQWADRPQSKRNEPQTA
ncbi:MAG: YihY/virulence factor BrkB family protein [Phycisphaerales bacterium]